MLGCTPLCVPIVPAHTGRKQEYLDIAIAYTIDVIKDKTMVNLFPDFMKWLFI